MDVVYRVLIGDSQSPRAPQKVGQEKSGVGRRAAGRGTGTAASGCSGRCRWTSGGQGTRR